MVLPETEKLLDLIARATYEATFVADPPPDVAVVKPTLQVAYVMPETRLFWPQLMLRVVEGEAVAIIPQPLRVGSGGGRSGCGGGGLTEEGGGEGKGAETPATSQMR